MTLLLASLIDATVVLTIALIAVTALRTRSAALRHAILATAVACAALMPVLEIFLPDLAVIPWYEQATVVSSGLQLTSGETVANPAAATTTTSNGPTIPWFAVLAGIWLVGALVTLTRLLVDLARLTRLRRRSAPVTGERRELLDALSSEVGLTRPVALLQSDDPSLLVTYGVRRPGIILPSASSDWTDERWRIVLRHELAHIVRHDAAIQLGGEILCVLQPVNPLVWLTCRRLRQESEYACDDAVLGAGVAPTTYADHLLDVARQLSHRATVWAAAPAIAHPSTLERRIVAMLQKHTNRQPLTGRGWAVAVLIALGVSLPLAAASLAEPEAIVVPEPEVVAAPVAQSTPTPAPVPVDSPAPAPVKASVTLPTPAPRQAGSIAGQVTDQTGGVIPGATLTLTDRQTNAQVQAISNAYGRFEFTNLAPAEYELVTRLSGFKSVVSVVAVSSGTASQLAIALPIGSLSETITVNCSPESFSVLRALFPVLSAQAPSTPVRVGGSIREPKKILDVRPTCPSSAPEGEHAVKLTGTIGVDGSIIDVMPSQVDGGVDAPADLVTAALEAVRQWAFTPTQLNGQPVEVTIEVTIRFTKS